MFFVFFMLIFLISLLLNCRKMNIMKKKRFFNKESSIFILIYRFLFIKFCVFDGKVMIDVKKICFLNVKNIVK